MNRAECTGCRFECDLLAARKTLIMFRSTPALLGQRPEIAKYLELLGIAQLPSRFALAFFHRCFASIVEINHALA
jgi:hypothetical protein